MAQRLTASERAQRNYQRMMESLRADMRREMERSSKELLGELRQQLTGEIQAAFSQTIQHDATGGGSIGMPSISSLTRIISTVLRLSAKPRMSSSTVESKRSQETYAQFRLSRGQSAADMSQELSRAERNL